MMHMRVDWSTSVLVCVDIGETFVCMYLDMYMATNGKGDKRLRDAAYLPFLV